MNAPQVSAQLFERSKRVSPGGVHSPVRGFRGVGGTPRFIQSARGAEWVDVDGNRCVDFCMSWGPLILGHQDEEVAEAVKTALSRGWSYGAAEPYSLELAEFLTDKLPWVERVRFVNSGTEAVMSALRVARAATGRSIIAKFDGCYHGHADSMLVRAGSGLAEMASPDSAGVPVKTAADTLVLPLNDLSAVERVFAERGSEIAAVIYEAIPANNGLLPQTDSFLPKLAQIARASGALLILDEVITGFRVGFGGVAERSKVRPDLVTYGKILGGGFPVGAYGGRADLMDLVAPAGPVYQAGTLSANPVAMAAGLATIRKLWERRPYGALERKTDELAQRLEKAVPGMTVQRTASIFWPVLGQIESRDRVVRSPSQIPAPQKERYAQMFHSLLESGYYLAPSGYEVSFLSTAHTDEQLDGLVEAAASWASKEGLR